MCEECGAPIVGRKAGAKTCSVRCGAQRRTRLNREEQRRKYVASEPLPARMCDHCGAEFIPYRANGRFCSRLCGAALHQKKKLGRADQRPCSKCGEPTQTKPGIAVCDACRVDPRGSRRVHESRRRLRRYGVTEEWLAQTLAGQGGRCAICGTDDPDSGTVRRGRDWCIDHDHATGKARGLLCSDCNLGLGVFRDDPDRLASALAYLMSHAAAEAVA